MLDIPEIARQYEDKLRQLDSQCKSLINLGQKLEVAKTDARLAQSALYDTAQTVRGVATFQFVCAWNLFYYVTHLFYHASCRNS